MANGLSGPCALCGTWRRSLHRDHIVPRFKGGTNELENIQLICANCHEDKTVEDLRGRRQPPEEKERQRQAQLGSKRSELTRLRMQIAHLEKRLNDPEYDRMIRSFGTVKTPEHIAKVAAAVRGQKRTPEQRARMSAAHLGKTLPPEVVEKIAAANRGRKNSEDTRARMSAAQKGKPRSDKYKEAFSKKYECADCKLVTTKAWVTRHECKGAA